MDVGVNKKCNAVIISAQAITTNSINTSRRINKGNIDRVLMLLQI